MKIRPHENNYYNTLSILFRLEGNYFTASEIDRINTATLTARRNRVMQLLVNVENQRDQHLHYYNIS